MKGEERSNAEMAELVPGVITAFGEPGFDIEVTDAVGNVWVPLFSEIPKTGTSPELWLCGGKPCASPSGRQ